LLTLFFIPVAYSIVEERKERRQKAKEEARKAKKMAERSQNK